MPSDGAPRERVDAVNRDITILDRSDLTPARLADRATLRAALVKHIGLDMIVIRADVDPHHPGMAMRAAALIAGGVAPN
jgi:hypothetical protein